MSNPKRAKETISLIEDYTRNVGVIEWFIPFMQQQIADLEREILSSATNAEETAKMKIKREAWIAVLDFPAEQLSAHRANLASFVKGQKGIPEMT